MDTLHFPTAGPMSQVLGLTQGLSLKINWGFGFAGRAGGNQANHPPANSTGTSPGLALAPKPVRPAPPGSLEGKKRRRVEIQDLEEEPKSLQQGGAKPISAAGQERRKWGGGIVHRYVTLKAGLLKGLGAACSGQRIKRKLSQAVTPLDGITGGGGNPASLPSGPTRMKPPEEC